MSEARADDLGSQFPSDAADSAPLDPTRNRAPVNYVVPPKTPKVPVAVPTAPTIIFTPSVREALVSSENANDLTCVDTGTELAFRVAKPHALRKDLWDGQTVSGKTYEYLTTWLRRWTDDAGVTWSYESLYPRYSPGFSLIYAMKIENGTSVIGVSYIDVNADSRHWRPEPVTKFLVTVFGDNNLTCKRVGFTGGGDPNYTISLPFELRRDTWDGNTIDGSLHTYAAMQTRTSVGSVTETQIIIPPYVIDQTIILACSATNGPLLDLNQGARAWSEE